MIKKILKKAVPDFALAWHHRAFPILGALLYRFPSRKLVVIGIAGTNGKSTVVQLITDIFKEAGFKTASISSVRFQINGKEWQNKLKMTMPGRLKIQRFLRQAVSAGCQYAVLEVTSEGIKQFRHKLIKFDLAIITNSSKEHIEAHGGFENYRRAKGELFKTPGLKISMVNLDDENADYFLQFPTKEKWGYRIKDKTKNTKARSVIQKLKIVEGKSPEVLADRVKFSIDNVEFDLRLLGEFNIYNALSAICVGLSQGISLGLIKQALEKIQEVSGRMELVIKEPFKVYVDYAHTTVALESVYKTLSAPVSRDPKSKLICLLGACGGGRDKWKRPEFGRLASEYCDKIILANEDPYDENPIQIIEDVEKGIFQDIDYEKILDRREAIKKVLAVAKPGDTVIITGKGSEPWLCAANGKKIPWDDRQVVREEQQGSL